MSASRGQFVDMGGAAAAIGVAAMGHQTVGLEPAQLLAHGGHGEAEPDGQVLCPLRPFALQGHQDGPPGGGDGLRAAARRRRRRRSRQDQMDVAELVPQVTLLQGRSVRPFEQGPAGDGLQHGQVGRLGFVPTGQEAVDGP